MSNNKQQTAVQWFLDKLIEHRIIIVDKTTYQVKYKHEILLEQAKEIEKEIIIKTYIAAKMERNLVKKHFAYFLKLERVTEKAEKYYNKNYNNEQR